MSSGAGGYDPYDVPPSPPPPSLPAKKAGKAAAPKPTRETKQKKKQEQKAPAPDPRTAWEAVWHAYQPVRDKYPTLDSRPTSAALAALLDLPVRRPLSYQENRTSCKGDFNLPSSTSSRNRNLKAALLQASAAPSEQACSRCAERKNLWDACVGGEGCAGCTYNGNGKQCSNRPEYGEEAPELQAHEGKSPSGRGASAFVCPTDAERLEEIKAMTAAERDSALRRAQQDLRLLGEWPADEDVETAAGVVGDEVEQDRAPAPARLADLMEADDDEDNDDENLDDVAGWDLSSMEF
ncbi:hypothetical protein LQW54_005800 [Pestalotiopsis sp. IQ-011]